MLLHHLLKVDVRYVKRIPLTFVKNVTFESVSNAFQNITTLHDIKAVYLFTVGCRLIVSHTSRCFMIEQLRLD